MTTRNSHTSWHPLRNILPQVVPFLGICVSVKIQPHGDALINNGEQATTPESGEYETRKHFVSVACTSSQKQTMHPIKNLVRLISNPYYFLDYVGFSPNVHMHNSEALQILTLSNSSAKYLL
jgi:hypothetical protein